MIENELCKIIVEHYYDDIYNFCYAYLRNIHAAEDCAQETFLLFVSKRNKLYLSDKIRLWLYKAAKKTIKKYIKKNSLTLVSYDDVSEEIADKNNFTNNSLIDEIFSKLSKDEADLLIKYFNSDHGDRKKLADEYGISLTALYKRVDRIRGKLIDEIDKSELHLN